MEKLDGKTFDVVNENIDKLKELFPHIVTDGEVDFEKLQQTLGKHTHKSKERYDFTWNGKSEAIQLAQKQTTGTLRPCKEESVNWDSTENLYVEGDNLEVLRTLQNSYRNKVKMIYIDPPYNTGNDFIYKDDFHDNINYYLKMNSENMKSNPETNGRFHTDWLNLMYPRLKVAKMFLKSDGVILVSINDKELSNLIKIMNEIYGEENHLATFVWKSRRKPINVGDAKFKPQRGSEYVLMYCKNADQIRFNPLYSGESRSYPYQDSKGKYRLTTILKSNRGESERSTMRFEISGYTPPQGQRWQGGREFIQDLYNDGNIEFKKGTPFRKYYEHEEEPENDPFYTFMDPSITGSSESGKTELNNLIGNNHDFDTVKPKEIVGIFIDAICSDNDIVIDFFSGSATTAHAVMDYNANNNKGIKFVLVQIPEETEKDSNAYKNGFKTICEIGRKRINEAAKLLSETKNDHEIDFGYKTFKLDSTNLKVWDEHPKNVESNLLNMIELVKEDRSSYDVVYEILLKYGVDLSVPVDEREVGSRKVFDVGMGYLLICLEHELEIKEIEDIAKHKPARVVFYDTGFKSDTVRTNAQQILKRNGVEDIRVI